MVVMVDAALVKLVLPSNTKEPVPFFVEAFADPTSLIVQYALAEPGGPPALDVFEDAAWFTDPMFPARQPIAETQATPPLRGRWTARGPVGIDSPFPLVTGRRYLLWSRLVVSVSEAPVMLAGVIEAI